MKIFFFYGGRAKTTYIVEHKYVNSPPLPSFSRSILVSLIQNGRCTIFQAQAQTWYSLFFIAKLMHKNLLRFCFVVIVDHINVPYLILAFLVPID